MGYLPFGYLRGLGYCEMYELAMFYLEFHQLLITSHQSPTPTVKDLRVMITQ